MKELPPIFKGVHVHSGWDRREQTLGHMYQVRTEVDPKTGIHTEWQKPVGREGFFTRIDSLIDPNFELTRTTSIMNATSLAAQVLPPSVEYDVKRRRGGIREELSVDPTFRTGDALVEFRIDEDEDALTEVKFIYLGSDLRVEVKRKEVNLSYENVNRYIQTRSFEENLNFLKREHQAHLAQYPPLVAVSATLFPDHDYDELMSDPEFDIKKYFEEQVEIAKPHPYGRDISLSDFELPSIHEEVGSIAKHLVDMITEPTDEEYRTNMIYGLSYLIRFELPDDFDLVTDEDERNILLEEATEQAVGRVAVDLAHSGLTGKDLTINFHLDPGNSKAQLGTSSGATFTSISEEDYEPGQPYMHEGVTYVVQDKADGIVVSWTPLSGKNFRVQAPRRIELDEVRAMVSSESSEWINVFDRLGIKSDQT